DRAAIESAVAAGALELPSTDSSPLVARELAIRTRADGLRVVTGRVDTRFGPQSLVLTLGRDVAFGVIPQRNGPALRLEARRGVTALVEGSEELPAFADPEPDFALPTAPTPADRALRRRQESAAAGTLGQPAATIAPGQPAATIA